MILPSKEELDEMAKLLTSDTQASAEGHTFAQLGPDQRARVVELCYKGMIAQDANDMSIDFTTVADWFKHSKLWDGPR